MRGVRDWSCRRAGREGSLCRRAAGIGNAARPHGSSACVERCQNFDGRAWRGAVDGVIGGIPCQPHSLAGKRLEREDSRYLWSTARRIIVQSGAWFVLIENVEEMLSSGGAERVYRDLGRLGFAREVGLFTAAEVGASHQRGRTFILSVDDTSYPRLQGRELSGSFGERYGGGSTSISCRTSWGTCGSRRSRRRRHNGPPRCH
ncbi:MAG: DNA cytosine methyltransferase [Alphaproteobacteria bacterium]|nr:MAG: DNA cytosine methyltransferase [Alphaproteobacteria bacterium]